MTSRPLPLLSITLLILLASDVAFADDFFVCVKEPCYEGSVGDETEYKGNTFVKWNNVKSENWVHVDKLRVIDASYVSVDTVQFRDVVYESSPPYDGTYQPNLVKVESERPCSDHKLSS